MRKIILDTDLGSDCDDAGALVLLHRLADAGKVEILGVTHCGNGISGVIAVKAINTYFGRPDIPIGHYTKADFLIEPHCKRCSDPMMSEYLCNYPMPYIEDATVLMRKLLIANKDIILIGIGMSNNFYELLQSTGDEISMLSGKELVQQSVRELHIMGGDFQDFSHAEYNVKCDIVSAQFVADNFPKPIIYCGFEIGNSIRTGQNLGKANLNSPVKRVYRIKTNDGLRESWDPITVYAAAFENQKYLRRSDGHKISIDEEGKVVIQHNNGKDGYWIMDSSVGELEKEIDRCMYD